MGSTFTKIKYSTEGAWGTTEYKTLYLWWNRTVDVYTLFDTNMKPLITFDEFTANEECFVERLIELLTKMPDEENHTNNVEYCTGDEIKKLEENIYKY